MPYSDTTDLALIACPGAENFTNSVVTHLKRMYKFRFMRKMEEISRRYEISKDEATKQNNFHDDLTGAKIQGADDVKKYRMPPFKVETLFTCFANGEFKSEIMQSVRGKDVYIFQDVENAEELALNGGKLKKRLSINDHLMTLLVTIDAARQAAAGRITLVLPVFPYSRQHKRKGREALTASMLSHIYEHLGVKRIITLDIHSREIINAFSTVNLENLHASYQIIRELGKLVDLTGNTEDLAIVSPDTGAVDRNKFYASGLKVPLAMLYKERNYSVVSKDAKSSNIVSMKLLGNVKGKVVFMADDMLGTGGTLLKAMAHLKEAGAEKVIAAISLPFFTGGAEKLFDEAYEQGLFYRIIGTNAVYHEKLLEKEWYINTDVSSLFASIIMRIHHNQSIGAMLDNRDIIDKIIKKAHEDYRAKHPET